MSVDEAFYKKQCSELNITELEDKSHAQLRKRIEKCKEQTSKCICNPKFPFTGTTYYINWFSSILLILVIWVLTMSGIYKSTVLNSIFLKCIAFVFYTALILFLPNLTTLVILINTWITKDGAQTLSIPFLGNTKLVGKSLVQQ